MNRKIKLIMGATCVCMVMGMAIIAMVNSKNPGTSPKMSLNTPPSTDTPIVLGDYAGYHSLKDMCADANAIVNGVVVEEKGVFPVDISDIGESSHHEDYRLFDIKVIECLEGTLSKGDIVTIKMPAADASDMEAGFLIKDKEYVCFSQTYEDGTPASLLNPNQAQVIIENEDVVADDAGILFEDTKLKVTKKKGSKVSQGDRIKNGKKELLDNIRQHSKENKGKNKKK